jgi:hypothetical protein
MVDEQKVQYCAEFSLKQLADFGICFSLGFTRHYNKGK